MRRSSLTWTILLGILLLAAGWLALALGSYQGKVVLNLGWPGQLGATGTDHNILVLWRAPRVVAAAVIGVCLALSGLVLQGVTHNPLADPYLLGISGGAGLMVVLLHGIPGLIQAGGWWLIPVAAFLGAQGAVLLVLLLARGAGGRLTILGLILAGVVINAFCAALMTFALARFDPFRLRVTTLWLAGGIGYTTWQQLLVAGAAMILSGIYLRAQAHRLNAFALGPGGARTVGVNADKLLVRASLISSLLTGVGVSLGGLLGYVGLIVPHLARLLVGRDFRASLPVTAVAGALLLTVADTCARLVLIPEELPVGVLTALLGCPLLVILLRAQLRGGR